MDGTDGAFWWCLGFGAVAIVAILDFFFGTPQKS